MSDYFVSWLFLTFSFVTGLFLFQLTLVYVHRQFFVSSLFFLSTDSSMAPNFLFYQPTIFSLSTDWLCFDVNRLFFFLCQTTFFLCVNQLVYVNRLFVNRLLFANRQLSMSTTFFFFCLQTFLFLDLTSCDVDKKYWEKYNNKVIYIAYTGHTQNDYANKFPL